MRQYRLRLRRLARFCQSPSSRAMRDQCELWPLARGRPFLLPRVRRWPFGCLRVRVPAGSRRELEQRHRRRSAYLDLHQSRSTPCVCTSKRARIAPRRSTSAPNPLVFYVERSSKGQGLRCIEDEVPAYFSHARTLEPLHGPNASVPRLGLVSGACLVTHERSNLHRRRLPTLPSHDLARFFSEGTMHRGLSVVLVISGWAGVTSWGTGTRREASIGPRGRMVRSIESGDEEVRAMREDDEGGNDGKTRISCWGREGGSWLR